jgi:hypothetical protein
MGVHFFHCTDGIDLVIDREGQAIDRFEEILSRAQAVASALMGALPGYEEWAGWSVHVYDELGLVAVVDFPVQRRRAA